MDEKNIDRIVIGQIEEDGPVEFEGRVHSLETDLFALRRDRGLQPDQALEPFAVTLPEQEDLVHVSSDHDGQVLVEFAEGNSEVAALQYAGRMLYLHYRDGRTVEVRPDSAGFQTIMFTANCLRFGRSAADDDSGSYF